MQEAVTREVATDEINGWLDYKKLSDKKREAQKDGIETLIDAVVEGTLTVTEEKVLVHALKFELGQESKVTSLEYKPRLAVKAAQAHLQGVKSTDFDGRVTAYVAALTGKNKEIIKSLDTEDYSVAQAIALFFI